MKTKTRRRKRLPLKVRHIPESFTLIAYFKGMPHRQYERMLCKIVGRSDNGTGMWISTMMRDISWVFAKREAAIVAAQELDGVPGLRKIEVLHSPAFKPSKGEIASKTFKRMPRPRKIDWNAVGILDDFDAKVRARAIRRRRKARRGRPASPTLRAIKLIKK